MRIRTVKPELFTHDILFEIEQELKLPVRLAYIGLWCAADREGIFQWEPRRLGIQILPYDSCDFSRVLDALLTRGFLVKYRVGEIWFGAIPSWHKHQFINNREKESELPKVDNADEVNDASSTRLARVEHAIQGEGKGREGKGKERILATSSDAATVEAVKPPKPRNDLLDALATIDGSVLDQVSPSAWGRHAKALKDIKTVMPNVSAAEIRVRAANYKAIHRDWALTSTALASHWGNCSHAGINGERARMGENIS
jgi:hypothetical protein